MRSKRIPPAQAAILADHQNGTITLREAMKRLKFKENYNRFYRLYYHFTKRPRA